MALFGGTSGRGGKGQHESSGEGEPRVLIVAQDAGRRAGLDKAFKQDQLACELADSAASAIQLLVKCEKAKRQAEDCYQAAVIDAEACTPATIKLVRELGARHIAAVLLCPNVTFDEAVAVMRAGAADIVSADIKPRELLKRVRAACKIVPSLGATAAAAPSPYGKATPISAADNKTSVQTPAQTLTADFQKLIFSELDVEALLRHALEFVLGKLGPTNAAVFLPGSTGDFQLGAYVNFSCQKETAEVMLDQLANIAAPRLERTIGVIEMADAAAIEDQVGEGAEWLGGQRALAFSCRQEDETLAVFMVFRDRNVPFPPHAQDVLEMIREEFGKQLARVIRIHHRHLPRDKWGRVGDGLDAADEDDLAA